MLATILAKLTPSEREWLLARIEKPKRVRGQPKKVEDRWRIYWDVLASLEADNYAHGAMKKAIGAAAAKYKVSDKTIERIVDADLARREADLPRFHRMFEKIRRAAAESGKR